MRVPFRKILIMNDDINDVMHFNTSLILMQKPLVHFKSIHLYLSYIVKSTQTSFIFCVETDKTEQL